VGFEPKTLRNSHHRENFLFNGLQSPCRGVIIETKISCPHQKVALSIKKITTDSIFNKFAYGPEYNFNWKKEGEYGFEFLVGLEPRNWNKFLLYRSIKHTLQCQLD
jgi:hypothetical protein